MKTICYNSLQARRNNKQKQIRYGTVFRKEWLYKIIRRYYKGKVHLLIISQRRKEINALILTGDYDSD